MFSWKNNNIVNCKKQLRKPQLMKKKIYENDSEN